MFRNLRLIKSTVNCHFISQDLSSHPTDNKHNKSISKAPSNSARSQPSSCHPSSKQENHDEMKFAIRVQLTVKYENGIRMGEKIDKTPREKKWNFLFILTEAHYSRQFTFFMLFRLCFLFFFSETSHHLICFSSSIRTWNWILSADWRTPRHVSGVNMTLRWSPGTVSKMFRAIW